MFSLFLKKNYDNKLCALLTESNFPFSALEDANLQNHWVFDAFLEKKSF